MPTLNVFDNSSETRATVLILFEATRVDDVRIYFNYCPTVATYWGTGGARVPYWFRLEKEENMEGEAVAEDTPPAVVRRLTPTECERLQGFPDDWTDDQADSNRYKQMGNAVTVNVIRWIGERL